MALAGLGGRAVSAPESVNNFDILKEMSRRDLRIFLGLDVLGARKSRAGSVIEIGIGGDFIGDLAAGRVAAVLMIWDRVAAQPSPRDRGQRRERRRKDRMSAGRKLRRPSAWRAFRERLRETKATTRPVAMLLAWVTQRWRRGKTREAAS